MAGSWKKEGGGGPLSGLRGVVLTGGSSGIGRCIINLIHSLGSSIPICNLSRTKPGLEDEKNHILHVPCDLGNAAEVDKAAGRALAFATELPPGPIWLVNNSGFGGYGRFPEPGLAHNLEMIDVNVRGAVQLTGQLLPEIRRRGGAIGNVVSTAAFQPTAFMSVYGAGKVFLLHWSLALGEELRPEGVSVTAICPGPTSTGFFKRAGFDEPVVEGWLGQTPEDVAGALVKGMLRRKRMVVPGIQNKALAFLSSKLPKRFAARVAAAALARYRMKR